MEKTFRPRSARSPVVSEQRIVISEFRNRPEKVSTFGQIVHLLNVALTTRFEIHSRTHRNPEHSIVQNHPKPVQKWSNVVQIRSKIAQNRSNQPPPKSPHVISPANTRPHERRRSFPSPFANGEGGGSLLLPGEASRPRTHHFSLWTKWREVWEVVSQRAPASTLGCRTRRFRASPTSHDSGARVVRLHRLEWPEAYELLLVLSRTNAALATAGSENWRPIYTAADGNPLILRWHAATAGRKRPPHRSLIGTLTSRRPQPGRQDPLECAFHELLDRLTRDEVEVMVALSHFSHSAAIERIVELTTLSVAKVQLSGVGWVRGRLHGDLSAEC